MKRFSVILLPLFAWTALVPAHGEELTNKRDTRVSTTLKAQRPNQPTAYLDEVAVSSDDPTDAKTYVDEKGLPLNCSASQVPKRNTANTAWECAADATGTGTLTPQQIQKLNTIVYPVPTAGIVDDAVTEDKVSAGVRVKLHTNDEIKTLLLGAADRTLLTRIEQFLSENDLTLEELLKLTSVSSSDDGKHLALDVTGGAASIELVDPPTPGSGLTAAQQAKLSRQDENPLATPATRTGPWIPLGTYSWRQYDAGIFGADSLPAGQVMMTNASGGIRTMQVHWQDVDADEAPSVLIDLAQSGARLKIHLADNTSVFEGPLLSGTVSQEAGNLYRVRATQSSFSQVATGTTVILSVQSTIDAKNSAQDSTINDLESRLFDGRYERVEIPPAAQMLDFGIAGRGNHSSYTRAQLPALQGTVYRVDYRDAHARRFVLKGTTGDFSVRLADLVEIGNEGVRSDISGTHFYIQNDRQTSGDISFSGGGIADIRPTPGQGGATVAPGYAADIALDPHSGTRFMLSVLAWSRSGGAATLNTDANRITQPSAALPRIAGSSGLAADAGHRHLVPANVTTSAPGLMPQQDKVRLDGLNNVLWRSSEIAAGTLGAVGNNDDLYLAHAGGNERLFLYRKEAGAWVLKKTVWDPHVGVAQLFPAGVPSSATSALIRDYAIVFSSLDFQRLHSAGVVRLDVTMEGETVHTQVWSPAASAGKEDHIVNFALDSTEATAVAGNLSIGDEVVVVRCNFYAQASGGTVIAEIRTHLGIAKPDLVYMEPDDVEEWAKSADTTTQVERSKLGNAFKAPAQLFNSNVAISAVNTFVDAGFDWPSDSVWLMVLFEVGDNDDFRVIRSPLPGGQNVNAATVGATASATNGVSFKVDTYTFRFGRSSSGDALFASTDTSVSPVSFTVMRMD